MSNEIKTKTPLIDEVKVKDYFINTFKREKLEVDEMEIQSFLLKCKLQNLNPFLNEVYAVPFYQTIKTYDSQGYASSRKVKKLMLVTNYLMYFQRAQEQSTFRGIITDWSGIESTRPYIEVKIYDSRSTQPDGLYLNQRIYAQDFGMYKSATKSWEYTNGKPFFMLEKTAQANALRKGYKALSELPYIVEEISNLSEQPPTDDVVPPPLESKQPVLSSATPSLMNADLKEQIMNAFKKEKNYGNN